MMITKFRSDGVSDGQLRALKTRIHRRWRPTDLYWSELSLETLHEKIDIALLSVQRSIPQLKIDD